MDDATQLAVPVIRCQHEHPDSTCHSERLFCSRRFSYCVILWDGWLAGAQESELSLWSDPIDLVSRSEFQGRWIWAWFGFDSYEHEINRLLSCEAQALGSNFDACSSTNLSKRRSGVQERWVVAETMYQNRSCRVARSVACLNAARRLGRGIRYLVATGPRMVRYGLLR